MMHLKVYVCAAICIPANNTVCTSLLQEASKKSTRKKKQFFSYYICINNYVKSILIIHNCTIPSIFLSV